MAIKHLDDHAKAGSTGHCAQYVREAIEAGFGIALQRPGSHLAKDYGSALETAGFVKVRTEGGDHRLGTWS